MTADFGEGRPTEVPSPPAPRPPGLRERVQRSPATYGLVAITVAVFLAQMASTALTGTDFVALLGAKVNAALAAGQVWRLVTPIFVHVGPLHLLVNMYSVTILGPTVERLFGWQRMLALYLFAGVGGVVLSLAFGPPASAGASGAIFGLVGALSVFLFLHRQTFGKPAAQYLRQLLLVAALNLAVGFSAGIDNWGHLGGLLSGAALAWSTGPRLQPEEIAPGLRRLRDLRPWTAIRPRLAAAGLLLAALAWAAALSPFSR